MDELDLKGIVLLGESQEAILKRIKDNPRWGKTVDLQGIEADYFFNCERKNYKKEAEEYGYRAFTSADEAEEHLVSLIK